MVQLEPDAIRVFEWEVEHEIASGRLVAVRTGLRADGWPGPYLDRQPFMKGLRSSPFLPVASLLQETILDCCAVGSAA